MSERTDRRQGKSTLRVTLTSLLVASGIGVVGVVPALAESGAPAPAAFATADRERTHHGLPDRWFRNRGDFRYVWFRVCDGTVAGASTTTTTTTTDPTTTTTDPTLPADTVAPDAVAAAVEGAAADTSTDTTTTDTTTTETTTTGTTTPADPDTPDAEAYPTFVVVPLPKDEAKKFRSRHDRPCYDLTTGAPRTTDPATTTDTTTTDTTTTTTDVPPVVETTTTTPAETATG